MKATNGWTKIVTGAAMAGCLVAGCGGTNEEASEQQGAATSSVIKHVFVIAMENHDGSQIYGNTTSAPYINNTLIPAYAHTSNFNDPLALSVPSEPHYVWMEAGTNVFSDHTFSNDNVPSSSNSTSSTAHLSTQIKNATNGVTWMAYQEGINGTTGSCPIAASGFYMPKHDPFVFFKDVSGNPPSKTNAYCIAHHKDLSALAGDLTNNRASSYNFITPNQCHDMHGQSGCASDIIKAGDDWLAANLPALVSFSNANAGVVFIVWDEGSATAKLPFLAVGPHVKANYTGAISYTHSSLVKSVDRILELPTLATVSSANELSDLFVAGFYP